VVDIGAEIFAVAATSSYALHLNADPAFELADAFARGARRRVDALFDALFDNDDAANYKLAQKVLEGRYQFLEEGIVHAPTRADVDPAEVETLARADLSAEPTPGASR
jgi:hypothetical protein